MPATFPSLCRANLLAWACCRTSEGAGRGGQRGANAEREGVEAPGVDADDRGGVARLADGIERLPPDRPVHEVEESENQRDPDGAGKQAVIGQDEIADPLDATDEGGRLQGKGTERNDRNVAQEEGQAEGDDEPVLVLALGGVAVERRQQLFNSTQRPICRSEFEMRAGKVAAALRRYLSGEKTRSAGG